ncbi:MAG: hypothetical protein D6812_14490, partial [Deltaproteobacteria bacterium]
MMKKRNILLLTCLVLFLILTRRDFSRPHVRVLPDMQVSPAYESQSENTLFRDGLTMRRPVPGTIPRGFTPFPYGNSEAERRRAAAELKNPIPRTYAALDRGRFVFENFCAHCHGIGGHGDGGVARRFSGFSMSIVGKGTVDLPDGEIFHILTYGRNNMPGHAAQIPQEDRWKAILYLRDLQEREAQRLAALGLTVEEDPRKYTLVSAEYGAELFGKHCASCHGKEGKTPQKGIPRLNNPRVLAVADENFYLDIITHGRKGSIMPAWEKVLTPTQLRSIVAYIRSWLPARLDRSRVASELGDPERGRKLFRGNCAPCHGAHGEGGIAVSLNSPTFLAVASDAFLRDTITKGRKNTAMPAWPDLTAEEVSDLLAYIRSWGRPQHTFADVAPLIAKGSARIGKKIFRSRCSACHGKKGEGGIGSRLDSQSFLSIVDDRFLYRAIMEGRPGTAMPAWHFLEAQDVADLIRFIRKWQKTPSHRLPNVAHGGRPEFGKLLYERACIACHGPEGQGGLGGQIANPVFLDSASDEFLWRTIAYGKEGTPMRGFLKGTPGGALMDLESREIDHIIAYLRDLQVRPRVEPLKRPTLNRDLALGRFVYEEKGGCAKCHGSQGEGASGPALGNHDFLSVASDGYLIATTILGRANTQMLSFWRGGNVKLTDEEIEAVVAYIRNFANLPETKPREGPRSPTIVSE